MANNEEPWDELMGGSPRVELKKTLSTGSSGSSLSADISSRWAQYEKDAEKMRLEANSAAVTLAAEQLAAVPAVEKPAAFEAKRKSISLPIDAYSEDDEDDDEFCGEASNASIRAEALKMLELADDHMAVPYSVRRTQTGGFQGVASGYDVRRTVSGGFSATPRGKHIPRALAGLDFTKRASSRHEFSTPSYRDHSHNSPSHSSEEDNLMDLDDMGIEQTPESKWSSRYSLDHTLMAMSGGNMSDMLNKLDRDAQREATSARNMYISSPHETSGIFGSGFSFRQNHVFGKQNVSVVDRQTNLRSAWTDNNLDSNGNSLKPPENRKTWQEQVERKKRQQRRLGAGCAIIVVGIIAIFSVALTRNKGNSYSAAYPNGKLPDVVFYVTSDAPYDSGDEKKLSEDLRALPSDAKFLVHLGNIQNSAVTLCAKSRYPRVKSVLMKSPVPMFILPGEEDWNNCPSPENAWDAWEQNFGDFESNFNHNFMVDRQSRRKENFAFVSNHVLFVGFHMVGGRINSEDEWETRVADNINWLESMVSMQDGSFDYLVLLGNARPAPQQRKFFDRLKEFLGPVGIPIIYIHANSGVGGVLQYDLFGDDMDIQALQIEDGGKNPPLRISVFSGDEPFVVG